MNFIESIFTFIPDNILYKESDLLSKFFPLNDNLIIPGLLETATFIGTTLSHLFSLRFSRSVSKSLGDGSIAITFPCGPTDLEAVIANSPMPAPKSTTVSPLFIFLLW